MTGPGKPADAPEAAIETEETPTRSHPIRRRCANCGAPFQATRKDHKFCKQKCRRQFHEDGTAYGKLKQILTKHITREVLKQLGERAIVTEDDLKNFVTPEDVDRILTEARYISLREITPDGLDLVKAAARRRREQRNSQAQKQTADNLRAALDKPE